MAFLLAEVGKGEWVERRGAGVWEREVARRDAGRWFVLAVGSLAVAGLSSMVLVAGRIPGLAPQLIHDPEFARRSLVVHVNLALGVWFFACVAGLFCLLPGARRMRTGPVAVWVATAGMIGFTIPMFFRSAMPILSDYVPTLDYWLFLAGIGVFAGGVALNFVDMRLVSIRTAGSDLPRGAQHGVRGAAWAFLVALLTIGGAYITQDRGMESFAYYERLFWGGGHVLQVVNVMGMLAAWLVLLREMTGRPAVRTGVAGVLFGVLLLPTLFGPWLTLGGYSDRWFTRMMEYGIFPVAMVFLILGIRAVWRDRGRLPGGTLKTPEFVGLATSAGMMVIGFVLGGMITISTTLVPAHYHANIGAVTVAYMVVVMTLLPKFGAEVPWGRAATWQPLIFGVGQMTFAFGLAAAGTWGHAARKVYGSEQHLRTTAEKAGLIMAGVGGGIALVGGVLFVAIVTMAVLRRKANVS